MPDRVVQLEPGEDAVIIAPPGQTFTYHDPATGYWVYRNKAKTRTRLFAAIGGEPDPPPPPPDPEPEPDPPGVITVTPSTLDSMLRAARPGDVYLAKPGSYGRFTPPSSGTSDRPITIRFEAGAIVDGKGARQFGDWHGVHDLVLEDIALRGFRPDETGVLSMTGCSRLTFRRPRIVGCISPRPTNLHQDHALYFRGGRDILVEEPYIDGGYSESGEYLHGGGIHAYRDTPVNIVIRGGKVTGMDYGLMLHAAGSNNRVEGVNLAGNRYGGSHSRVDAGWTVRP
jgi:hypothetical protein